jgi:hypothetical protein
MHSSDRHTRWVAFFVALMSVLIIGPTLVALGAIDWLTSGFAPSHVWQDINWADVLGNLGLASLVWVLWHYSRDARQRERLRARALAGDLAMMPEAVVPGASDLALEAPQLPIEYLWHGGAATTGVIANEQGLVWRRPRKRDVLVPWSQARLFEVWDFSILSERLAGYTLYGRGSEFIDWFDARTDARKKHSAEGLSFDEMRRRERILVQLITARTSLPLRTLSPELMRDESKPALDHTPPVAAQLQLRRRLWVFALSLLALFAAVPLVEAVAILLVPLTRTTSFNRYAAATMATLGLFILGFAIKLLAGDRRHRSASPAPSVLLPTALPEADGTYRIVWSASWRQRIFGALVGLALLPDVPIVFIAYADFETRNEIGRLRLSFPHNAVTYMLFFILMLGLVSCSIAVFEKSKSVVANFAGIATDNGKQQDTLRWDEIVVLLARTSRGKIESYAVIADDIGHTEIGWPAGVHWDPAPRYPGQPEAGPALAAIAAERTGLTWITVADSSA